MRLLEAVQSDGFRRLMSLNAASRTESFFNWKCGGEGGEPGAEGMVVQVVRPDGPESGRMPKFDKGI